MTWNQAALDDLVLYVQTQQTTGLLLIHDGAVVIERNWPVPPGGETFIQRLTHGVAADGALLEDVASQQKSFVALLVAVAIDKGLLDVAAPVSALLGGGWSKARAAEERAITVRHLLEMTCGLTETLTRAAAPGEVFFYNTPAYALLKPILEAVSGQPLEAITREWLTAPAGMADTAWRRRPAELAAASGNPTGLVTTPRDVAKIGQVVLSGGLAADASRIVSGAQLAALFVRTQTNPAYGRLWWLNGGAFAVNGLGVRTDGPLVPPAPSDLRLALGAQGRMLGVSRSAGLIAVRLGQQPADADFLSQFWRRLVAAVPGHHDRPAREQGSESGLTRSMSK